MREGVDGLLRDKTRKPGKPSLPAEIVQIQALDRTQPGLPMKMDRAGTMTHDDIRHGTTTLFAALNVRDGTVIGRDMQRHRHQEFIRFLNQVEAAVIAIGTKDRPLAEARILDIGIRCSPRPRDHTVLYSLPRTGYRLHQARC